MHLAHLKKLTLNIVHRKLWVVLVEEKYLESKPGATVAGTWGTYVLISHILVYRSWSLCKIMDHARAVLNEALAITSARGGAVQEDYIKEICSPEGLI